MTRRTLMGAAGALLTVVALVASPRHAAACSMCQCGDPTYRLLGDDFFSGQQWRVSLDADQHSKDQVAEDDATAREKETEHRVTLAGSWQPTRRLRFVSRVPFTRRTIESPEGRASLDGVSDPDLFVHFNLLERGGAETGWWLAAMTGIKSAWGQNDLEQAGERAEEHLQPGSGAVSTFGGLAFARGLGAGTHVYASVMGRWNGKSTHDYRYGDALLANASLQRALSTAVSGSLELNYRVSKQDDNGEGLDANTGGAVLYVSPKLRLTLFHPLGLQLGAQIPVADNLNGDQREFTNFESGLVVAF